MPKMPIKLGRKMKDLAIPVPPMSEESGEMFYPSLYLEWEKPYNLPDEGTMTVKFRKTRSSKDVKNDRYTEDIDVLEIVNVKATKSDKKSSVDEAGDALDKLRDDADDEKDY